MLLALTVAQNGYDYNKPNRGFGSGPSSNRPGSPGSSSGSTTPYPVSPQNDDFGRPATGYPSGPQNYPSSSQRPGYPGSSYPGQGSNSPSGTGSFPGGPNTNSNYPQGSRGPSSGDYPGQSDSSYPQGSRGSSNGFPGQGSRYPEQGQNYPGQPGSNYGNEGFSDDGHYEGGDYSAIPGIPDIDYPILSYIPQTNFNCDVQQLPGYYADVEARCQIFHVCANNKTYDFICPNGTIFSQEEFVCVWWNQFECESAPGLYELNAKIYDYSIRGSSDYPSSGSNDYSGSNYPGGGPQGTYPGFGNPRPNNNYPSNSGPQGPTTPFSSVTGSRGPSNYPGQDNNYPGSNGPTNNYPGNQNPSGNYPGSQGPSGNYPDFTDSGSYPQGPSGDSGSPGSRYPSSSTPYPTNGSTNQGYPTGRPSGTGFPGGKGGRKPQKPNREYLPPRNKRTKQSKHLKLQ